MQTNQHTVSQSFVYLQEYFRVISNIHST